MMLLCLMITSLYCFKVFIAMVMENEYLNNDLTMYLITHLIWSVDVCLCCNQMFYYWKMTILGGNPYWCCVVLKIKKYFRNNTQQYIPTHVAVHTHTCCNTHYWDTVTACGRYSRVGGLNEKCVHELGGLGACSLLKRCSEITSAIIGLKMLLQLHSVLQTFREKTLSQINKEGWGLHVENGLRNKLMHTDSPSIACLCTLHPYRG